MPSPTQGGAMAPRQAQALTPAIRGWAAQRAGPRLRDPMPTQGREAGRGTGSSGGRRGLGRGHGASSGGGGGHTAPETR